MNLVDEVCSICGSEAVGYFDKSRTLPLCDSTCCEVALVGEITSLLNEDAGDFNEGAEP